MRQAPSQARGQKEDEMKANSLVTFSGAYTGSMIGFDGGFGLRLWVSQLYSFSSQKVATTVTVNQDLLRVARTRDLTPRTHA